MHNAHGKLPQRQRLEIAAGEICSFVQAVVSTERVAMPHGHSRGKEQNILLTCFRLLEVQLLMQHKN